MNSSLALIWREKRRIDVLATLQPKASMSSISGLMRRHRGGSGTEADALVAMPIIGLKLNDSRRDEPDVQEQLQAQLLL